MAIVSHRHRIVLFPLAKCGSTSLKHMFFVMETGKNLAQAKMEFGLPGHVHNYYPGKEKEEWLKYYDHYETIVVIRDPIERLLSTYGNRVVHAEAIKRSEARRNSKLLGDLPAVPDLSTFVDNLEIYLKASARLERHVVSQATVVGNIFHKIKNVYKMSQLNEIPDLLSKRRQLDLELPHKQTSGPKFKLSDLRHDQIDTLIRYYADDYEMLRNYYKPPV